MEWKEVTIADIAILKNGKKRPTSQGTIPVYGGNGIMDYVDVYNDEYNIVVGRVGAYCGCVYLSEGKCWVSDNAISVKAKQGTDNKFLFYLLCNQNINHYHIGGAQPLITQDIISRIEVSIPKSEEHQHQIAIILTALDSKIENNNKINANLEAQAQALFKSWFVDFTPFKDQPFVDSELGSIPQGWKVGKLGDICTFKRGKNLLSKNAIDEGVPVVAGGLSPSCYHNQANTSAPVVTVSGSGANAGFMRMYHVDVWASDCSFIDVSCDYLYFVYCFLSVNRRLLKHAQTGAVQPHVKPADIHDFDVVIPEEDIVKAFQSIIKELLTKVGVNEKENQRLAALRDTLLPKLMSGEIKL
ncbi:MAG: restriction endonuclease subunit S [Sodaliphilus sp.]